MLEIATRAEWLAWRAEHAMLTDIDAARRFVGSCGKHVQCVALLREAGGLGDVICTFPTVLALRHRFPDALVVYFGNPYYRQLVGMCPEVDVFVPAERKGRRKRLAPPDAEQWPYLDDGPKLIRDYLFVADCWCPAPKYEHIMFRGPLSGWISRIDMFLLDNNLEHVLPPDLLTPSAVVPDAARDWAEGFIEGRGLKGRPIVGIQPYSTTAARDWPPGRWKAFTKALRQAGVPVLVFDSNRDPRAWRGIEGIYIVGQRMPRLAALVAECSVVVCPDSGLFHLAAAVETPCIGLFGPTLGRSTADHYPLAEVVQRFPGRGWDAPNGCLYPCHKHRERGRAVCLRHCRALEAVTADEVLARVGRHIGLGDLVVTNPFTEAEKAGQHIELTLESDGEALVQHYREAHGFDPTQKGEWQARYAEFVAAAVDGLAGRRVLDVGTMMGSQASAFADLGADVYGCDVLAWPIQHSPFDELRGRLVQLDVCDMHLLRDEQFDVVHASQVLEHVSAERVPQALAEIHRVLKPSGLFLATLPAFPDEPGGGPDVDCTHVTLMPRAWWVERLEEAGMPEASGIVAAMIQQPMQQEYEWGILAAWRRGRDVVAAEAEAAAKDTSRGRGSRQAATGVATGQE